jgi:wyosine [tRNA(Phe)-imidazoG37] synthetase (radical SAM superfamily)
MTTPPPTPWLPDQTHRLFASHPRGFRENCYVYPVVSRRAGGLSIGVNVNPDKRCNFRCGYCQVDRTIPGDDAPVDLNLLGEELDATLRAALSGELFARPEFRDTPAALRRVCDIAISGDGEPTAFAKFEQAVARCAEARRRCSAAELRIVLITNATLLHRDNVRRGLAILDANNGEIWAKLDAGTEAYFGQIARSAVSFQRILDNLLEAARARPIVVQSLFLRAHGLPMPEAEQEAYCDRLCEINAAGGTIRWVQAHTVARRPAEAWVEPLSNAELDAVAERIRRRTGLFVTAHYGVS